MLDNLWSSLSTGERFKTSEFHNSSVRVVVKVDEIPTEQLPFIVRAKATRKPPKKRVLVESSSINLQSSLPYVGSKYQETEAQTDACGVPCECKAELTKLMDEVAKLKHQKERQKFRLANISHDDSKICFYTGFPSYKLALKACYSFLGPAITSLSYSSKTEGECSTGRHCHPRTLQPEEGACTASSGFNGARPC